MLERHVNLRSRALTHNHPSRDRERERDIESSTSWDFCLHQYLLKDLTIIKWGYHFSAMKLGY